MCCLTLAACYGMEKDSISLPGGRLFAYLIGTSCFLLRSLNQFNHALTILISSSPRCLWLLYLYFFRLACNVEMNCFCWLLCCAWVAGMAPVLRQPLGALIDGENYEEDPHSHRSRRAFGKHDYMLPENFKTLRRSDIPVTYRLHDDLLRYYR